MEFLKSEEFSEIRNHIVFYIEKNDFDFRELIRQNRN